MHTYYCQLGSAAELAWLEIKSLVPDAERLTSHLAKVNLTSDDEAIQLQETSGGIVRIAKGLTVLPNSLQDDQEGLTRQLSELVLTHLSDGGDQIALAEWNRDHLPALEVGDIKQYLKQRGRAVRYRQGSRLGLSAAILLHHRVLELVVIGTDEHLVVAQTVAVQNIDAWSLRDRGRPFADRRRGMLPLKVARMLVNIAGAHSPVTDRSLVVYDPFCGTGSILMEAVVQGAEVLGSDQDPTASQGTLANLRWLVSHQPGLSASQIKDVFTSEVTAVTQDRLVVVPDVIVTEPFLGKLTPEPSQWPNIQKGLMKLYLGAFRRWRHWLPDQAIVVFIWPYFENQSPLESWQPLIDNLTALGYTSLNLVATYSRPQAVTHRAVTVWQFNRPQSNQ